MTAAEPQVTVVVAVKDRREGMMRCLDGLAAQEHPSFEVLVMDNGSTDGTPQACRERAETFPVDLRVEHAGGILGRVRNRGVARARGEVVAFTDSDCRPAPGWLSSLVAPLADARVGVVTGVTRPADPPPYGPWFATIDIREQTWRFETCNAAFRRRALLEAGGFDEALPMWEDTDGGWAVLDRGWRAAFAPGAVVHHDVTYPGQAWHLRRALRFGGAARVVRRHPAFRDRLWLRLFLSRRTAEFTCALAGLALSPCRRRALLLALPYVVRRRPGALSAGAVAGAARVVAWDAAVFAGLAAGSLRWRRLVL